MRWVAGLVAVLVLPACGDGSRSHSEAGVGANQSGAPADVGSGQLASVRIIRPDSGSSSPEGSTITIEAAVTDPNATIVRVEFYDDNRLIGSKSSPPYIISYGRLKAGTSLLCAAAIDVEGKPVSSAPVTLFVVQGNSDGKDDGKKDDDKKH
jgi:chitinase